MSQISSSSSSSALPPATTMINLCASGVVLALSAAALGYSIGSRSQQKKPRGDPDNNNDTSSPKQHPVATDSTTTTTTHSVPSLRSKSPRSKKNDGEVNTRVVDESRFFESDEGPSSPESRTFGQRSTSPITRVAPRVAGSAAVADTPSNPLSHDDQSDNSTFIDFFIPTKDDTTDHDRPPSVRSGTAASATTTTTTTTTYVDVVSGTRHHHDEDDQLPPTSGDLNLDETQGGCFLDHITVTENGYLLSEEGVSALTKEQETILRQMEQTTGGSSSAWSGGALDASVTSLSQNQVLRRKSIEMNLVSTLRSNQDSLASSGLAANAGSATAPVPHNSQSVDNNSGSTPMSGGSRSVSAVNVRERLFGRGSFSVNAGTSVFGNSVLDHTLSPCEATPAGEAQMTASALVHTALQNRKYSSTTTATASPQSLQSPTYYHSESGGILSNPDAMADTRKRSIGGPLPEYPIWRICVTGGPCSGKSSGMGIIKTELQRLGFRVFIVPEVATLLIQGGLEFSNMTEEKRISQQCIILRLIMELEDTFFELATSNKNPSVILCDRGTLDGSAYCSPEQFNKVLKQTGYTIAELRDARYDGVVHLVTAAIGAEAQYTTANNEARRETAEEASAMDLLTREKWTGHRMLGVFDNSTDFDGKMKRVVRFIKRIARIRTGEDDTVSGHSGPPMSNDSSAALIKELIVGELDTVSGTDGASATPTSTTSHPNNNQHSEGDEAFQNANHNIGINHHHHIHQSSSPENFRHLSNSSFGDMMYINLPVSQILRPKKRHNNGHKSIRRGERNDNAQIVEDENTAFSGGEDTATSSNPATPGKLSASPAINDEDEKSGGNTGDSDDALVGSSTLSDAILAAKENPLSVQNSDMDVLEALVACGVPSSAVVTDYLTITLTPPLKNTTIVREKISRQKTGNTSLYFHIVEKNQLDASALGKTFAEKDDIVRLGEAQSTLMANGVRAEDVAIHRISEREFSQYRRNRKTDLVERKTLICFFHKGKYFKFTSYFKPDAKMVLKVPEDCKPGDLPAFFEYEGSPVTILANTHAAHRRD